jgi:hypothetical protein
MTEPRDLERYIDDFGRRLAEGATAAARPRAARRRLAVIGAVAVAVAGVVVGLLDASAERLDPVAEAQAALASPGEIVYMRITSTFIAPGAGSVPRPQTIEQWSALDPPRWRFVQTLAPAKPGRGGMYDAHGPITGRQELSYANGSQRSYIADRDELTVSRGFSDKSASARVPSPLGPGTGDLQTDLRSLLAAGKVTDEGEREIDGRTVRRLVIEQHSPRPSATRHEGDLERRFVYDVDPHTFAPIQGTLSLTVPSRPHPLLIVTRMHVDAYERIPLTAASTKLLRIQTTARTKVIVHTAQERRARQERFRKSCHTLKSGVLACRAPASLKPPKLP